MTTSHTDRSVSRRTALTGLGAGGLGLALAATTRQASAQDATPAAMASHPIVGCCQNAVNDPGVKWTFSIFHADGTYHEWNGSPATAQRSAAIGVWRPRGERTADVVFMYEVVDAAWADSAAAALGLAKEEFTATWRVVVTVDEAGDALTYAGDLDLRGTDGTPKQTLSGAWPATRVTIEHNPATGSTATRPTLPTGTSTT